MFGLTGKQPQHPGVSIGTERSPNPNTVTVRYDGALENTAFGHTLYEADRILKGLTLGVDNLSGQPMRANAPGFKNFLERFFTEAMPNSQIWLTGRYQGPGALVTLETTSNHWPDHWNTQVGLVNTQRI